LCPREPEQPLERGLASVPESRRPAARQVQRDPQSRVLMQPGQLRAQSHGRSVQEPTREPCARACCAGRSCLTASRCALLRQWSPWLQGRSSSLRPCWSRSQPERYPWQREPEHFPSPRAAPSRQELPAPKLRLNKAPGPRQSRGGRRSMQSVWSSSSWKDNCVPGATDA
jgi:hypothetical protein